MQHALTRYFPPTPRWLASESETRSTPYFLVFLTVRVFARVPSAFRSFMASGVMRMVRQSGIDWSIEDSRATTTTRIVSGSPGARNAHNHDRRGQCLAPNSTVPIRLSPLASTQVSDTAVAESREGCSAIALYCLRLHPLLRAPHTSGQTEGLAHETRSFHRGAA
jgi:hypothetical protein